MKRDSYYRFAVWLVIAKLANWLGSATKLQNIAARNDKPRFKSDSAHLAQKIQSPGLYRLTHR